MQKPSPPRSSSFWRIVGLGLAGRWCFLRVGLRVSVAWMSSQEAVPTRKRRAPKPKGETVAVGVRLQPPDLADLDSWIAQQPEPRPPRPEAIRQLIGMALWGRKRA